MEQEQPIERKETGIRILLSVLFMLILRAVEIVLGAIVLFQLVFTLITKRRPGDRVVMFANRVIAYVTQLLRYLTYQDDLRPFPFSDFPAENASSEDMPAKSNGQTPASFQNRSALTGH